MTGGQLELGDREKIAARLGDEWRDARELLPEPGEQVLVFLPMATPRVVVAAHYGVGDDAGDWWAWGCASCGDEILEAVTHWRPLPPAPEGEEPG